ncbi:hypothetical protein Poli38472_001821 [Pythium oligandrum]|uniref:WW domain-containing protein n=1 Tax=Pythium oligandrum TaxID=41045 RepID=A0A8K1CVX4_PYTOL|nr:hypothetical protein Poli38472_001821 [Pythium oligandrum]|eukprot:TMW69665.1 hypothetical protein Poli38472_001821 [Pythium oligandrum]
MEHRPKTGIWTEHVDAATGRTYYFNMVHNRSYWELPEELVAHVKKPLIETLREWEPELTEKEKTREAEEEKRQKREELLAAASASESTQQGNNGGAPLSAAALQERMAQAAQKKAEAMQRLAPQKSREEDTQGTDNEYLQMVRQLQEKDRSTEDSGGKWLVR